MFRTSTETHSFHWVLQNKTAINRIPALLLFQRKSVDGEHSVSSGAAAGTDGSLTSGNASRNLMGAPRVVPAFRKC